MKKIIRLMLAGIMLFQIGGTVFATPGLTDISGHKYETAIQYLLSKGVVSGYADATFKPDNQINRAELLKILVGGAGYNPSELVYKNCFPDVKTEWYAKYVCFAKEKNWVKGYDDGTFKPEQPSMKVEAMKMLLNAEGFPIPDKAIGQSIYSDVDFSQWFGPYMFVAESMDIVDIAGTKYAPMSFVTRGEVSNNIYRAMLILEQKVGSFDQVVFDKVVNPPVVNQQFDAPVLTASSTTPNAVLLKWTVPAKTSNGALKSYVVEYKVGNDVDYTSNTVSVEYYAAELKANGGMIFISLPSTMYHFRVKALNVGGESSVYSNVETLTTAQPLEPAAPTVSKVSQTFSAITLKVTLPKYTGDSALDSIFEDYTNPNDGSGQKGSTSIAGNNIGESWTVTYQLFPDKTKLEQPNYEFSFWVNNKNGKVGNKVVATFPGLSVNPDRPTVSTAAINKNSIDFNVKKPDYYGSTPITDYYYSMDSSSKPGDQGMGSGSYGKDFFENNLKGVLTVGNMLSPNTTYTVSFWVKNADGRVSDKVTKTVTTSAN
ncbi:MAG: S-layer homology domain-containing protein [Candidatus Peregrinibacteria bacterium]|nr:S-layer homology domain-containing protein [Candidatus Peregrinibacteria bacterium]